MKIGVYGCSWCAGVDPDYIGWPKNLAQMLPKHEINDYSLGGMSLEAILYWFEKFKDHNDINIIKLTRPHRLTLISNDHLVKRQQITPNYSTWENKFSHSMTRLQPQSIHPLSKHSKKLHKLYYTMYNKDVGLITAQAMAEYLKNHNDVHMIFSHDHRPYFYPNIEKSTENFIPNFKSYIIDDGAHLSYEGVQLEAEYVKTYLIDNLLLT
jgi:hypothetical protein